tara:strand:- start:24 stop:266 length:243 start_codon:yes stop_codon:yes gene_type:complete
MLVVEVEVVLVWMLVLLVMVVVLLVGKIHPVTQLHLLPSTQVVVEEEMETMDLVVNLAGVAMAVLDLSLSHTILDKYLKT